MGDCPSCQQPPLAGQIVELPHPSTDSVTYGVICPNCGTVFTDAEATEQMRDMNGATDE